MKIRGVYAIRHTASGRAYVGSAVDVQARWRGHCRSLGRGDHHSRHLQAAWDRFGPDGFALSVLEAVADKADLIAREQWWIDQLNASFLQAGFNAAPLAGSVLGIRHSAETKARWSADRKGQPQPWNARKHTAEQNAAHSAVMTGRPRKPYTPEARAKLSASKTGQLHSAETCAKLAKFWQTNRAAILSVASRAKMSAAARGNKHAAGNKNKLGYVTPAATRTLMSAKATGNQNARGFRHSDEARARMSAGQKARQARERAERSGSLLSGQAAAAASAAPRSHGPPSPAAPACRSSG